MDRRATAGAAGLFSVCRCWVSGFSSAGYLGVNLGLCVSPVSTDTLMTVKIGVLPLLTSLWKGRRAELICTDFSIIFHGLFPALLASSGFPISHAPSRPHAIYGINLYSLPWRGKMTLWACSSPSKKGFSSPSNYKFLGFLFGSPSLPPFSTCDFC